jgi:hypothetical protein
MGLLFISDEAARPQGGAHPDAHLWDYGSDPVAQLDHILDIRHAALNRFGERNIRMGRPMADLEDVLVPIYLYHRYQTEATVKLIGGVDYTYNLRGDGQKGPQIVDAAVQRSALDVMLQTLDPEFLALPEHLLDLIPPRPARIPGTREHFRGYTEPLPDPVAMAEVAADHAASLIFNPERSARLMNQSARNDNYPNLTDVTDAVLNATLLNDRHSGYLGSIQRGINVAVLRNLLNLAAHEHASPDVKSVTKMVIENLQMELSDLVFGSDEMVWNAHYRDLIRKIDRYLDDPSGFTTPPAPYMPPGAPIGSGDTGLALFQV